MPLPRKVAGNLADQGWRHAGLVPLEVDDDGVLRPAPVLDDLGDTVGAAVVVVAAAEVVVAPAVVVVVSSPPQAESSPPIPAPTPTAAPAMPAILRKSRRLIASLSIYPSVRSCPQGR